jgi:hypothetical protein
MKRVTGIGGIFFNARDPELLRAWYKRHLGIDVQEWGGAAFSWSDADGKPTGGTTIWSIGAADGDHFAPSAAPFMVNYRVADLAALVQRAGEGRGLRVRQVRLGHRSGRQQGRAVGAAARPVTARRCTHRRSGPPRRRHGRRSGTPGNPGHAGRRRVFAVAVRGGRFTAVNATGLRHVSVRARRRRWVSPFGRCAARA